MAIVYSYPEGTPTLSDTVLGTQFDYDGNGTKSFSIADIIALANVPSIIGLVPYAGATQSVNLGIWGLTAASITKAGGTASEYLMADGSISTGGITGTGTINYIPVFTAATAVANSQIYQTGTNISIGGTTASTKLDIQGNIFTRNSLYFGQLAGSAVPQWSLTVDGSGDLIVDDVLGTENFIFSNTGNVFFSNAGQVMVGTTLTGTPYYGVLPQLTVAANTGGVLDIRTNEANVVANTLLGRIQFSGKDDAAVAYTSAAIETISAGQPSSVSNGGGILKLMTSSAGYGTPPTERMRITENGVVQPGLDNAYSLGASGIRWSAVWATNGTIQTSDEREKKDIVDADLGLDFVSKLRPVSFKWKVGKNEVTSELDGVDEEGNPLLDEEGNIKSKTIVTPIEGKRTHYGLIAQEVEALLDGKDFGGFIHDEKTNIKGLRYDQFIPILINAIKELKAEIESLKTK